MSKVIVKKTPKDVQEDISVYVKNKKVDVFISTILDNIFKEKPENPIAWIIEFIQKSNTEETKAFFASIAESTKTGFVIPYITINNVTIV